MAPVPNRFCRMLFVLSAVFSWTAAPACLVPARTVKAADEKAGIDSAKVAAARAHAVEFLRTTQRDDGSWTTENAPGISGLVTWSLLRGGVSASDPMVAKALQHLATFV